jgi:hypothetical protein
MQLVILDFLLLHSPECAWIMSQTSWLEPLTSQDELAFLVSFINEPSQASLLSFLTRVSQAGSTSIPTTTTTTTTTTPFVLSKLG